MKNLGKKDKNYEDFWQKYVFFLILGQILRVILARRFLWLSQVSEEFMDIFMTLPQIFFKKDTPPPQFLALLIYVQVFKKQATKK